MDLLIRPASPHDASALLDVHADSYEAAYRGLIPDDLLLAKFRERGQEWYSKMIDAPGTPRAGTWVAAVDGAPAGFGHFRESEDRDVGELVLFYLLPEVWGKGVARPLLEGTLDDMRVLDFRSCRVEVFAENPRACRFYERAGFRLGYESDRRVYGDRELSIVSYSLSL
jgi:RimJ/RimL family protein N-acetyltransferase